MKSEIFSFLQKMRASSTEVKLFPCNDSCDGLGVHASFLPEEIPIQVILNIAEYFPEGKKKDAHFLEECIRDAVNNKARESFNAGFDEGVRSCALVMEFFLRQEDAVR